MKAFVTGGTGLLGTNLVHQLVENGHAVTVLARSPEKAAKQFAGLKVHIVRGDMNDIEAFAPAMQGHDTLFHAAAYFREYFGAGDHWPRLEKLNVAGTVRVLEEAERHGINKAIYVSSSGVIGKYTDNRPSDENAPVSTFANTNLYFKSKVVAEQAVANFLKTHTLPVVLILPGWMFGPHDAAPTTSGQLVLDLLHRKLPGIIPGGGTIADARDVAQAMINAVERGKSGARYIVAGRGHTLAEVAQTLERVSGVPAPRLHIPYAASLAYAWVAETYARLTGSSTLVTVSGVQTMHDHTTLSSAKAERELGATFRPLEETLHDEVAWYRANGHVTNAVPIPA